MAAAWVDSRPMKATPLVLDPIDLIKCPLWTPTARLTLIALVSAIPSQLLTILTVDPLLQLTAQVSLSTATSATEVKRTTANMVLILLIVICPIRPLCTGEALLAYQVETSMATLSPRPILRMTVLVPAPLLL